MMKVSNTRSPIPKSRNVLYPIFYPTHPMVLREIAREIRIVRSSSPRNWVEKEKGCYCMYGFM